MITPELLNLESGVAGRVEELFGVQVEITIAESAERGLYMVVRSQHHHAACRRSLCNRARRALTDMGFVWTDRDAETWKSHGEVVDFFSIPGGAA